MLTRKLGRSGIDAGAIGMGCWAAGGPAWRDDHPIGWGEVDDAESIRAIHRAIDLGANLFDTANVYGCGHSERVLGKAIAGKRDQVVIATKFYSEFDEETKQCSGGDNNPETIRPACNASLQRMGIDVIDLYQFHNGGCPLDEAAEVRDACEELVAEGKIRWYGWSTDNPEGAALFAKGEHCTAIQQSISVLSGSRETLAVCERENLASLNRGPLVKGLLSGKFTSASTFPENDVRHGWDFKDKAMAGQLATFERIRAVLTRDGRTATQGALCWLLTHSPLTFPIPGFKTVAQVEENAAAADKPLLSPGDMAEIANLLGNA